MYRDEYSRLNLNEDIIYDDVVTVGRWQRQGFLTKRPPQASIRVFRVTSALEGRPDLIAESIYGVSALDWVLIAFNNVREPLNWPRTGDIIEYPISSIVLPELI